MNFSSLFLLRGTAWTLGAFGVGQLFRVVTNVALARLLAPELFGIMVIVNSVRTGIDLITDVGVGQNIVQNPNANSPDFYNTAWTLRLIRGALLWIVSIIIANPVANFYNAPILMTVMPVAGLFFLIGSLCSVSPSLLQRKMRFVKLNVFETAQEVISAIAHVVLAYLTPTIWALVFGSLVAMTTRSASSYFLIPSIKHRFLIDKRFAWQIFSFGKWIFISSIIYFLSMNFDRLYFAKVALFGMVGIYGIARTISDLIGALVARLSNFIIFPLVASLSAMPRHELRNALAKKRITFLLISAVGIASLTTVADVIIRILYDQRYQPAAWMLPILLVGSWFSVISNLNESTLLGFGKPLYSAAANGCKFAWLLVGFPIGFAHFGILGGIIVAGTSDLWRYVPTFVGQSRERFSFFRQDCASTLVMLGCLTLFELVRWKLGFGTSFDTLPLANPS